MKPTSFLLTEHGERLGFGGLEANYANNNARPAQRSTLIQLARPFPWHKYSLLLPANNRQVLERDSWFIAVTTKYILVVPHNPEYWFRRADTLLRLGYPELAAGDVRKACLLLESALGYMETDLGGKVRSAYGIFLRSEEEEEGKESMEPGQWITHVKVCLTDLLRNTYRVLLKAVEFTSDPWEALHICQQAKIRFPDDDFFPREFRVYKVQFEKARHTTVIEGHDAAEANRQLIQGRVFLRQCPFVPLEYLRRSQTLITSVQSDFIAASTKCKLERIPDFNNSDVSSSPSDILGIFASSDIAVGDCLFVDPTVIGATNTMFIPNELTCEACCGTIPPDRKETVSTECCSAIYCSKQCQTRAWDSYHKVLCGKDFSWLLEAAKTTNHIDHPGLDGLVWLRVFALCVQSNCHPLEHPLLARLTPQYERKSVDRWSYEWNVDIPIRILRQLGIDIWDDHRFDTWVLQTVWARLVNNRNVRLHHGRLVYGVNPLFSFFNHSCEPNATWKPSTETSTGGTTVEITATRPIRKDEQIFISYFDAGEDLTKGQRQELLLPWLGQKCSCGKCQRTSPNSPKWSSATSKTLNKATCNHSSHSMPHQ